MVENARYIEYRFGIFRVVGIVLSLRQSTDSIPFPLDALPLVLREMTDAISVTTSTNVGMAGTAMLSVVGYCFSGLYRLAGKADHTEPPILYSIIIAQPS